MNNIFTREDKVMYKVIIVEDEEPIRKIICRLIDWNQLGFELVYEAGDGQEALAYLDDNQVDLIITDISMPFMTGLELCKRVTKIMPSVKMVILTGYNEFEYAQKAINLNVSHYLLKPITANEFRSTLEAIKIEMDEKFANQKNIELLRQQYNESKELLKNKFFMNLVLGYNQPYNLENLEEELSVNIQANYYTVGVMTIEDVRETEKEFWGKDRPLLEFAIYNVAQELLENINQDIIFFGPGNQVCMIFKSEDYPEEDYLNELTLCLEQIAFYIHKLFHMQAVIGLSDHHKKLSDLRFAYKDAITALEYKVLEGSDKIIIKSNIEKKSSFAFHKIDEQLLKLEYSIKVGDLETLKKNIEYIFSVIKHENIDINDFRTLLLKMIISIYKAYNDIRSTEEQEEIMEFAIFSKIFEMNDYKEIKNYYIDLCEKLSNKIRNIREKDEKNYVKEACDYIELNYSNPFLDLEEICKELFLSPGYFSRLFKKTTGITFVDYLTNVRMDKAKYMLANTTKKMYEISRDIGYEDPNYFSYNFKKNVNVTPSVWRKKSGYNNEVE